MLLGNQADSEVSPTMLVLERVGFFNSTRTIEKIFEHCRLLATNAGTAQQPAFEAFPSYIPSRTVAMIPSPLLVIDIGGTSTKVGIRQAVGQTANWQVLFEDINEGIKDRTVKKSGIKSFATALAKRILQSSTQIEIAPQQLQLCSIIWSNAFVSKVCSESSITGIVTQREMYKKGEWFNRDLKNGTDLGQVFVEAFEQVGIHIKYLLIGNDTPLTMKALAGANGGMVASTGLNGTLVKDLKDLRLSANSQQVICNAEMGGRFFMKKEWLSDFDLGSSRNSQLTIEELVAGGFLPRVFVDHIIGLANSGTVELQVLADYLTGLPDHGYSYFRCEDMERFISRDTESKFIENNSNIFSEQVIECLAELAQLVFARAGRLAAVVAYGTVCNQMKFGEKLLVGLDSSLCRSAKAFAVNFKNQLANLPAGLNNSEISAVLLKPIETANGRISVPMQGAANAIDSLCTESCINAI